MRTQLALALASLSVHLPAAQWGEGGAVRWFADKLRAAPPDAALPCLLELLIVLPQVRGSQCRPADEFWEFGRWGCQ